jgi:thiol-disulfide isomerase/thioredoxin
MRKLLFMGLLFSLVACTPSLRQTGAQLKAGDSMPSVRLVNLSNQPVTLESYQGQPILVNAWGVWCGPCRRELPAIMALQEKYRAAGLKIIGIDVLDRRDRLDAFLKDNPLNYETWLEGEGTDSVRQLLDGWERYESGVISIPYSFAVGRDGRVVGVFADEDPQGVELEKLIARALK